MARGTNGVVRQRAGLESIAHEYLTSSCPLCTANGLVREGYVVLHHRRVQGQPASDDLQHDLRYTEQAGIRLKEAGHRLGRTERSAGLNSEESSRTSASGGSMWDFICRDTF